jgi:hypothetical protein
VPRTDTIHSVEVTYADGHKEMFSRVDWQLYGLRDRSPIPANDPEAPKKAQVSYVFSAAQEVPDDR